MTLSYAAGTSTTPLLGETIGRNFDRTVARVPDAEALVSRHQGVRLTYAELGEQVDLVARALLAFGIEKGDRVGMWSANCAEWVYVQYATAKVGAILVNVNPAYRTSELGYALKQSGCRLLFSATAFKASDYQAMVAEVGPGCEALERVVWLGTSVWDDFVAAGRDLAREHLRRREAELDFDDAVNIQYTSGTTGSPKGATLSHHSILNNGFFVGELLRYTERDRVCVPVPFYHCFGMVIGNLACTSHGSCIVLPEAAFDAESVLETVQGERCTSLYGVPTMFIAELDHPRFATFDLSSLRTGVMAGAPCPVEIMKQVTSAMHMEEVTICYGMTELSPVATQTMPDDDLDKRVSTVGRSHPHVEVKIVDPASGLTVPTGTPGELLVRGYSVMLGYWNDPERTAEAIDSRRWMHTGDLATMDDEGYARIVGRIKDMIIRGGENVYPREIEECLYTHPDVAEVQVVGVPDIKYGEEVAAWVKRREGSDVSEDELRDFCRKGIAHFKVPRYFLFVEEFPMTVTGKVQKFKMRETSIELLGLQAAAAVETA